MVTKIRRTAAELVYMIRRQLAGRYANVPITIERSGPTWIALIQVESEVTRERIESAAARVRLYNDLTG
jgi:hypothetical protein